MTSTIHSPIFRLLPFLLAFVFIHELNAEVITIEVTIESVDAEGRAVTATRKGKTLKLDVSKDAKITVNGIASHLGKVPSGQAAQIDYETKLEIVTKIEASDEGAKEAGEIRRFEGHTRPVFSAAYSPTGKMIASCGADKTIRIWSIEDDLADNSHVVLSPPVDKPAGVVQVAFSPDGKVLISSGADGSIRVWDATSSPPELKQSIKSHTGAVKALVFSPDGKYVASGELGNAGVIRIWKVNGAELSEIKVIAPGEKYRVTSLVFSPDSASVCAGLLTGAAGEIASWTIQGNGRMRSLATAKNGALSVCYAPDGSKLAFADGESVRIIDAVSGKLIRAYNGHTKPVTSLAFSPNGRRVFSGGYDRTLRLWNIDTGEEVCVFDQDVSFVEQVAFSPDGLQAVSASKPGQEAPLNGMQLWRLPPSTK